MSLCLAFFVSTANAQTMPEIATSTDDAKAYFIVNSRCGKNAKFNGENNGRIKLTTDVSNATLWYFINAGVAEEGKGTPVKIYNVEAQKYINGVGNSSFTDDVTAAQTWYIKEQTNVYTGFAISPNADMSGSASWNNFQGSGNEIDTWYSDDQGSIWTFNTLDGYYAEQKAIYQAFATEAANYVGTELFYANQEKLNELNTLLSAATPNTLEGIAEAVANMAATADAVYNVPTTAGKYFFKGIARNSAGNYLTISNTGALIASATQATRSVWELAPVEGGYTLQNVLTGKYVQYAGASTAFTLVDEPVVMQLFPKYGSAGVWGTTAIGGTGYRQQMHEAGGNTIVGWEAGGASNWTLVEYADDMADALAAAETTLMSELTTAAAEAIAPLASILGVAIDEVTLIDAINGLQKKVYAAAANNHYRISSATHSIDEAPAALGLDRAANYPCGVAASAKDVDAVWQFVPCEGGVKIYSPNYDKYIAPVIGTSNPVQDCAKMVDYTNGGLFYIEVRDAATNGIRFKGANGNYVNMEGSGNKYVLDSWFESGSYLTLAQATTLDVDIANASIGGAYATAYLPFDVTVPAGDVKAYVGADKGTYIQMTEATAVAAKNGFILEGTAAGNVTLTIGATDAATSEISGTTSAITLDDSNRSNYLLFGIGKESNQLGFYKAGDAITTIAANKAFIDNATSAALPLVFGGETTGIESVETVNANAPMFDLSGRRILAPAKGGIYIQNGKKFIVK